jgi:hypothetical protein
MFVKYESQHLNWRTAMPPCHAWLVICFVASELVSLNPGRRKYPLRIARTGGLANM